MNGSVRKKGNTWYYRYYEYSDGGKKQIERKGGTTKKEALKKLNDELYRINNGMIKPSETILKDYLDMWLNDFVKPLRSENTVSSYKGSIDKYIEPVLGNLKLCDIKVIHIEQFLANMRKTKLSSSTIQKHFLVINAALNKAIKLQMLQDNPCKYVEVPKRQKHSINILSLDEIQMIYNKLDINKYDDFIFYLAIALTVETGLRRGEMCGLSWGNVDFDKKMIHVRDALIRIDDDFRISKLKTESSYRNLPLSDEVLKLLKHLQNLQRQNILQYGEFYTRFNIFNNDPTKYDLVFVHQDGKYIVPSNFLQRLKRICGYCEINKNIRWHDLRHSNATLLLKDGVSMKVIQERLGHSMMQTTADIYAHVTDEMNRDATNVISNSLYKKISREE